MLEQFSATERASSLDLLEAASLTESPERAALYLRHARDEARHAEVFWRLAQREVGLDNLRPAVDTEGLFAQHGEAAFLAFVHLGETRGRIQFEIYEEVLRRNGHRLCARAFSAILRDEVRHESYSLALLHNIAPNAAIQTIRKMRARRLLASLQRMRQRVATHLYAIAIWPIHLLGWLALRATQRTPVPTTAERIP